MNYSTDSQTNRSLFANSWYYFYQNLIAPFGRGNARMIIAGEDRRSLRLKAGLADGIKQDLLILLVFPGAQPPEYCRAATVLPGTARIFTLGSSGSGMVSGV